MSKKITISIDINANLLAFALEKTNLNNISFSELIEYLLEKYIEEIEEEELEDDDEQIVSSPFTEEQQRGIKKLAEQFGIKLD